MGNGQEAMEFKIFCGNKDLDGSLLQGVAFDEWVQYNTNTKVWYSSTSNILPVLLQEIKKEKPDWLFITGIYDWQFNFKPLLFCKGVKKIISVRGMLHSGALSQKSFKKKIYLGLWKLLGLHKGKPMGNRQWAKGNRQWAMGNEENTMGNEENTIGNEENTMGNGEAAIGNRQWAIDKEERANEKWGNVFHATDEAEKKYIEQVFGNSVTVKVAANFPNVLAVQPVVQKEPGELKLVSVALISAMKNVLLVLEALSRESGVWSREEEEGGSLESGVGSQEKKVVSGESSIVSSIEYNIYGPIKDKQYWEACEAQIKKLPQHITVNYHGDIAPDKIADALAANHVFILPSKSENFGHAIYEALSAGRPVITSNNTPWNKLEAAKAGINVSLNEPTELLQAIERFAGMKPEELEAWSKGARIYAEGAVDVEGIRRQYEEMFSPPTPQGGI